MNVMLKRFFILLLLSLLTQSCLPAVKLPELTAEEVLKKSAQVQQKASSVSFLVSGRLLLKENENVKWGGDFSFNGKKDDLEQIAFKFESRTEADSSEASLISADVFLAPRDEIYLHFNNLEIPQANKEVPVVDLIGDWWYLDADEHGLIRRFSFPGINWFLSDAVSIVKNRGKEIFGDEEIYHFDVSLDKEKLTNFIYSKNVATGSPVTREETAGLVENISANGQIWIDAKTFLVKKIVWDISVFTDEGAAEINLECNLSDYGLIAPLLPPPNSKKTDNSNLINLFNNVFGDVFSAILM